MRRLTDVDSDMTRATQPAIGVKAIAAIATPLVVLLTLDAAATAKYLEDGAAIEAEARALTTEAKTDVEKLEKIVDRVSFGLPPGHPDVYFLAPVFRFMKPTARQVLTHGGDCAYKARASIVMLDKLDISASKLVLHHPETKDPVHAVAQVDTDRGEYVVDLLFGVIYRDEAGDPIPLDALNADPALRDVVLDRELAKGNELVGGYPRDRYVYGYTRSINWDKNPLMAALYSVMAALSSETAVDGIERPYLVEEPALMVLSASAAAKLGWIGLIVAALLWRRRRASG